MSSSYSPTQRGPTFFTQPKESDTVHSEQKTLPLIWIYLLVASYFYVLPLRRLPFFGSTDLRAYDLLFIAGFVLVILPSMEQIMHTIGKSPWIKVYMLLCLWGIYAAFLTFIFKGPSRATLGAIYLYRFFSFGLAHAAILTFIRDRKHLVRLTWLFFLLCLFEGILSTLQGMGFLPSLWPDYWAYYGNRPVGTLGPNHLHTGAVSALGLSIGLVLVRNYGNIFVRFLTALGIAPIIFMSFTTQSRSGWVGIIIVIIYFLLSFQGRIKNFLSLAFVFLGILFFIQMAGEKVTDIAADSIEARITDTYETGGVAGIDRYRMDIWKNYPVAFARSPWVVITGTGLQNSVMFFGNAAAAHNNYVHVLVEMGFVGFLVYMNMLYQLWARARYISQTTPAPFGQNLAIGFQAAFLCILFMNLVSEAFYMQPSTYSLTGQIMAYAALALHPLWKKG